MKILVVDDERIVLSSCRRVLEAEGYQVMLAPSASAALEVLKSQAESRPAALLIDIKMPVHDGMYLMEQVRSLHPELPIIVMSGYATAETMRQAAHLGAICFIAKPFTPVELLETVAAALGKGENHGEKKSSGH